MFVCLAHSPDTLTSSERFLKPVVGLKRQVSHGARGKGKAKERQKEREERENEPGKQKVPLPSLR